MTLLHTPDFVTRESTSPSWPGYVMLAGLTLAGTALFWSGLASLGDAWSRPEYSHGPLIPLLSLFLFLRQMRGQDRIEDPVPGRWPGFWVMLLATGIAAIGTLARIPDIVTYGLVLWVYGVVLTSMGWRHGPKFWPPVVHLAFMLPLPAFLYWQLSIELQFLSSEFGVALIRAAGVPVFLEGNIIDLGGYRLHVAEACSGLRYLFPILSFSYIFAVLYQGPTWIKGALLLSAVPITIAMNSARIAAIGVMHGQFGTQTAEGFTHLFEGWVVFLICILLLFLLAFALHRLSGDREPLADTLDLGVDGLTTEAMRVRRLRPSVPMIGGMVLAAGVALSLHGAAERPKVELDRAPLALFPQQVGAWQAGPRQQLAPEIARVLDADDYHGASFVQAPGAPSVDLFIAWYRNQSEGSGIHSPAVCLPAGGWEMSEISRTEQQITEADGTIRLYPLNRAVIQHGLERKLVWYWFDQRGRRMTSGYAVKAVTLLDGLMMGRSDGALVRIISDIRPGETVADAETRMSAFLAELAPELPRFIPR